MMQGRVRDHSPDIQGTENTKTSTSEPDAPIVSTSEQTDHVKETGSLDGTHTNIVTTNPSPVIPIDTSPVTNVIDVSTTARALMIYDIGADKLIYTTDMNAMIYPASTTKIITSLYALTLSEPSDVFKVGDELSFVASDASRAKLKKGQEITLEHLLYAMFLCSGNDAAYVVAANVGRIAANNPKLSAADAVNTFLDGMNMYIKQLGMLNSNFACPDGYHNEQTYTTLHDMMIATKAAMQSEIILKVAATPQISLKIESGQKYEWKNVNMLISGLTDKNGEPLLECEGVFGLKTGYTGAAGSCLISLAKRKETTLAVLLFGSESKTGRFYESAEIINYAFDFIDAMNGDYLDKAA